MNEPFLSIIIPAYNEAKRLPLTLVSVREFLLRADYAAEVIVVDDGSTDNTADVVKRFRHLMPQLRLSSYAKNRGKGYAVREGMHAARGEYRLFMDADNSTTLDHFAAMLPLLESGHDVVIGSRTAKGAKLEPPQPIWRQAAGKAGNLLVQALVLPGVWDSQCGFKAFTAEAAKKIFAAAVIDGWGFDVEILAVARTGGLRIGEVPVRWANDVRSAVTVRAYLSMLAELANIRWRLWKREYNT